MQNLVVCSACHRHFRVREPVCPFCGGAAVAPPPRGSVVLGPGASRSRRYAVSAAFLAGSAVFACGETSNDSGSEQTGGSGGEQTRTSGGSKAASGGASAGGEANAAGKTSTEAGEGGAPDVGGAGGASGGLTASGGTLQSTGGTITVGGDTSAGTGGVSATGRACEGFDDRDGCRAASECPSQPTGIGAAQCVLVAPPPGCGNPMFLPQCPEAGCGDGAICKTLACGSECVAACTNDASCAVGNECVEGVCQPKPCGETQVPCPENHHCDYEATGPGSHCVPDSCESGDYRCESWQDCAERPGRDAHGCVAHDCTVDADCGDCGYCVNAHCAPQLGFCHQLIAMPYGCVWPDEELI